MVMVMVRVRYIGCVGPPGGIRVRGGFVLDDCRPGMWLKVTVRWQRLGLGLRSGVGFGCRVRCRFRFGVRFGFRFGLGL